MATILFDKEGKETRVEDASKVASMLENGFSVEHVEEKHVEEKKRHYTKHK